MWPAFCSVSEAADQGKYSISMLLGVFKLRGGKGFSTTIFFSTLSIAAICQHISTHSSFVYDTKKQVVKECSICSVIPTQWGQWQRVCPHLFVQLQALFFELLTVAPYRHSYYYQMGASSKGEYLKKMIKMAKCWPMTRFYFLRPDTESDQQTKYIWNWICCF